ncbi:hypothetical protein P3G55_24685 [Leptospira sp. 96542]|nr:hypothetical protein [Leptospira sp. 96542]
MNVRHASLELARRFPDGIAGAALAIGKPESTLRKELTGAPGYKWGVDDAELLTQCAADRRVPNALGIVNALAANVGAVVLPMPEGMSSADDFTALAETAREFSEFVASVAEAERDGKVTANELARVDKDFGELVARGQALRTRLAALHEAGKPAHLRAVKGGA